MRLLDVVDPWPPEMGDDELGIAATREELATLAGAINEVLEAVDEWEFDTRLGVTAASAGVRALPAFPKASSGGPTNTHVYLGIRNGKPVYGGITTNIGRRSSQHGDRFDQLRQVTTGPLTRGQARFGRAGSDRAQRSWL